MSDKMSKPKALLFVLTVMLSNVCVMADCVIYPITNYIYGAYPESVGTVNWILSGPCLLLCLSSLAAPVILKRISRKQLLVFAAFLFIIGGVGNLFAFESVLPFAVCRSVVGISQGLTNVVAVAILADAYADEAKRAKMLGYFNASMNIVGMICSYICGKMATVSWQTPFKLYWISIPILIMTVLFVPDFQKDTDLEQKEEALEESLHKDEAKGLGADFWKLMIPAIIFFTAAMINAYFGAVWAEEGGFYDSVWQGTAGSVGQIVSFILASLSGAIYLKARKAMPVFAGFLQIIAFALMIFFPGEIVIMVNAFFTNAGYILMFCYAYAVVPDIVPASKTDLAFGFVTAAYSFGSFLDTYVATLFMSFTGGSYTAALPIIMGVFILDTLLYIVLTFAGKRKNSLDN